MQDEESDFDYGSQSMRFDARPDSRPDPDFKELIRVALLRYEDVGEEFTMVSDLPDGSYSMADTAAPFSRPTLVPIGANFQVVVPAMMPEAAYRAKSAEMMRTLRILKINDPEEDGQFYDQNIHLINQLLGPDRTYEDINLLHNAFKKLNSRVSFEEYLHKNQKYWDNHFRNKDRSSMPRNSLKKKKKKGTIPI